MAEELDRFREDWRREIQRRKAEAPEPPPAETASLVGSSVDIQSSPTSPRTHISPSKSHPVKSEAVLGDAARTPHPKDAGPSRPITEMHYSQQMKSAMAIYSQAVKAEQLGDYAVATGLYRQSFKLDPNVDRAYERAIRVEEAKLLAQVGPVPAVSDPRDRRRSSVTAKPQIPGAPIAPTTLLKILELFPTNEQAFLPEDAQQPVAISVIPDELLVLVLCHLAAKKDVRSIERFALVSRKARLVSLDTAIWRVLAHITYTPPQISLDVTPSILAKDYLDYRTMYVNHPRVRYDGIYIAECHYVRRGHNENPWVNVSHLITYHRYLRFFPSGQVLSLLANDEVSPTQIIPLLKPSLKMKGHYIGTWRLEDTTVIIDDLVDSEGLITRYGFAMTLNLRSKPLGRWNRLQLEEYNSVKQESGESEPLPLKNERPFWFSKVRSYTP